VRTPSVSSGSVQRGLSAIRRGERLCSAHTSSRRMAEKPFCVRRQQGRAGMKMQLYA
jgi:hypothetical protein